MDGKLILGFLNYLFLGLIFVFGLISLLVRDQRKKLTFLFLALLSAGVLSYLFFAGIALILPGIILIFFYLLLYMFIASQEFFGFGRPSISPDKHLRQDMNEAQDANEEQDMKGAHDAKRGVHGSKGAHDAKKTAQGRKGFSIKLSVVINFILSLAVCAGAGAIFFIYNKDFLSGLQLVESFKSAPTTDIINSIGSNYIPAILVICASLFSSVFWFISILENSRTKN
jgi:hypothetical protein